MDRQYTYFKLPLLCRALLALLLIAVSLVLQGCPAIVAGAAGGTALLIHDRRDSEVILQDQKIESTASNRIYSDKKLDKKIHANVTSYNRVLLITGEVLSSELRDHTVNIVRNIPDVKRVHNELVVGNLTSLSSRSNDTLITSAVKSKMLNSTDVDSTRVKVVTENSVVYLLGLVSAREADAAVNIARNVDDVKRVVKIFELIPEPVESSSPTASKSAPEKK